MRKPSTEHYQAYLNRLTALEKLIEIFQKNEIYYYGAILHEDISIHIDEIGNFDLSTIFKINKKKVFDEKLQYVYVDIDGIEVRIVI